ncbi:hypothetical protein QJQ45_020485, partial [Haematococcus lacustris]
SLHDDLAAYMAATTLLPTKTPSATRALAAYRTSAGKPRSVAPHPKGQRSADPRCNNVNEETAAQMVASMFDAYPEGRVLGPASAQLSNLSMITLRDVHYTEGNLSGVLGKINKLMRVELLLKLYNLEVSEPYTVGTHKAVAITITANPKDGNHTAAMLGLLGEVITAGGTLSAIPCVQQEQGGTSSLLISRPLVACTPPTTASILMSVQMDANSTMASPTGRAVSVLGAKGSAASSLVRAAQYAVVKGRSMPDSNRVHIADPAFVLCSTVTAAAEDGNYLRVQFASPAVATAVEKAGPIMVEATEAVCMTWTPAASSQARGLATRATCIDLGVSTNCIAVCLDKQDGLAKTVQQIGEAVQSLFDAPLVLKRISGVGKPQTIAETEVEGQGDRGVAHFLGLNTATGTVALVSGTDYMMKARRSSRVFLCLMPTSVALSAAVICTLASRAASLDTILRDTNGLDITGNMSGGSFSGRSEHQVGRLHRPDSQDAVHQTSTAACITLAAAHVLLGDLDSKYSTAAIQRSMEGAAAEHSRAGKIAYNSHVEAKPSHLDQIFAACTPLLAAAVEYASDPASSAAEELRTTMRVQVESIHAIIAEAPPPPATTHQRQLQLGRGRHMAAQQNSRPAHTMSKQPSNTSAATSKGSRPTGGANVGAAAPAPQEEGTSPKDTGHEKDHTIDLTNIEVGETLAPPPGTTMDADKNPTQDTNRNTTVEDTPSHEEPARSRQRRDIPTVTLRPPAPSGTPRTNRPTTRVDTNIGPSAKRVRATKAQRNDTHTQTLMSQYLRKPTTGAHSTRLNPTIAETPQTTPDNDSCTSQHNNPPTEPPQATHNRQHITLTTFNVRGLCRSRNEVLNLVHKHSPDILILTETMTQPKSNKPSCGWLKRVMPNYTVHRHEGHSEVLIGIRHDLAIQMQATMLPPCTDADVNTRCVILSLRQRQSEELTLVATYWPSGNNEDAIPLRRKMQEHIRTATGRLPGSLILAGDINATMRAEDRSEHTEYPQDHMMREFATELRLSEADPGDRAWTYQQPHCNSRIDAILTRDARQGPRHCTHVDTNAYLSDHRPLTATLTTTRLGIDLAATHQPLKHSHTILTTPITNKDREAYRLGVQQPSSGAPQLHAQLTAYLAPMYTDATHFLTTLDKANPQQPQRLTLVAGLPAREAVDTAATMLTTLLETCRGTAMQTCNTKTLTRGGQHYQRRSMCKIRQALGKKLKTTRELSRKARMLYKQNSVHPSIDDLLPETDTINAEVKEAVQARQGDGTTENHVQAALAQLTNSYRDQIHKLDDDDSALAIAQARLRMQHLISTQPKKANKYILRPSRTDHKGLQALADPDTNNICTAPADLNRIITAAYRQKLTPPTPKTGHYTNTQTRNYPWTRPKAVDPFTLHTCQNVHWMHTAIMDKAGFQECISRLAGGKAPGPDGIENEIIKMLPWEMRDTIHQLFIIMWATGCTPTTWKTSDTCLLYKDKGQETDLNAYRPVGLANTIYKLWTSLITKTLYEYAEANGMLSNCQAGFRSHRDTTQQLQMLVMALEDAKLAKVDIYALLVDFTSAFNTTCQDKLLWIMHDLGFPTDATDAVKDLYTGATTRFRTPYGPTDPVPVDRGTIQGDSLSPFLFLIYIEPLLRWLQRRSTKRTNPADAAPWQKRKSKPVENCKP